MIAGLASLGYYGYTLADQDVYEGYANWVFDHQIAGSAPLHVLDYLRQKTPLGWVLGEGEILPAAPVHKGLAQRISEPLAVGSVLGVIAVPRLQIQAVVREGVTSSVLKEAVGHVPTTALAGDDGNFAIAAHRDTLFRGLKDIQKGDLVMFRARDGEYTYRVTSLRIVKPTEVSVLRPDGGLPSRIIRDVSYNAASQKLITLITCYPFYYVGSAPERFIVQGHLIAEKSIPAASANATSHGSGQPGAQVRQTAQLRKARFLKGFSHL